MINKFYSSVTNGNFVEKCSNNQHYVPEQPYLLKNNFLGEFITELEKIKVRANLGIGDAQTLYWGNIKGNIENQTDIAGHIDDLLSFDYEKEKGFIPEKDFSNVNTVRQAAIACLHYLSQFQEQGAQIQGVDDRVTAIIRNLYNVDTLNEVENSKGGIINDLINDAKDLQEELADSNTKISELESSIGKVADDIDKINDTLRDINELIAICASEDNALEFVSDQEITELVPAIDEEGNPILDEFGDPTTQKVTRTVKGGLYVKDLQPQINTLSDEISGEKEKISILQGQVDENTKTSTDNTSAISNINEVTIPEINTEIAGIKENYISKADLGDNSTIITQDKLNKQLNNYIAKDSEASVDKITSTKDTIIFEKPAEFPKGTPVEPDRYVQSYEELLSIDPKKAWPGMEVVVIDSATMYLLKDYDKETTTSFTANSWKISDSLRIEVLESFEDYQKLEKESKLQDDIYYYIKQQDFELVDPPVRGDYETDSDYNEAYQTWKEVGSILRKQIVTGAWAADLEARLKYKANRTEVEAYTSKVNNLESDLQVLKAFFAGTESGSISTIIDAIHQIYEIEDEVESGVLIAKINEVKQQIASIYSPQEGEQEATGILVNSQKEIARIKYDLYGYSPKFVTWDALGSTSSELGDGETLFVKTETYNNDKESQANAFSTKALSAESFVLGETELTKENDSLKFGNVLLAKEEDLIKHKIIKFNTYTEYIAWISNTSGEYKTKLDEDANYWNDWYFIVLDYEGTKPERNDFPDTAEGTNQYNEMIEVWETNTLINYKTAVSMFQPKGSYLTSDSLASLQNQLTDLTDKYNALIAQLESTQDPEDPETTI